MKEVEKDDSRLICEYTIENPNNEIYFYPSNYDIDFIIIGNDMYSKDFESSLFSNYQYLYPKINGCDQIGYDDGGIIKIRSKKKEVKIVIAYTTPEYLESNSIYRFNNDVFMEYYNKVKQEKLEVTYFNDSIIEGNITLNEDKLVYTSIPYDVGWNVYVDGQKVDTVALSSSLLCFNAGKGKHEIKIRYKMPRIELAIFGNIVAIVLFILLCIDNKRRLKEKIN